MARHQLKPARGSKSGWYSGARSSAACLAALPRAARAWPNTLKNGMMVTPRSLASVERRRHSAGESQPSFQPYHGCLSLLNTPHDSRIT